MDNITIIDIIKKTVIFFCVLVAGFLLLTLFTIMYGPYSPFLMTALTTFPSLILTLLLGAVTAKYIGEIVIVALKSKRE